MILPYKRPALNYPKQERFIDDLARFVYVEAGTKSGKTTGVIIWIHEELITSLPNQDFLWVAPNSYVANVAYLRLWNEFIPNSHKKYFKKNDTQRMITYPGAGRLWFKGGDRPDLLYSNDHYAAVIDEASRVKEASFKAVLSTLTNTSGALRCIGNLQGKKNWFYREARKAKRQYDNGLLPKGCIGYHKLTSFDNPSNDPKTILEQKEMMSEEAYNQLYLAEVAEDGSNPFGSGNIDLCVDKSINPLKTGKIKDTEPLYCGVDIGSIIDYTVVVGLDTQGGVAYFERFKGDWNEIKARVIHAVGNNFCLADDTGIGKTIVQEIKASGQCYNLSGFTFMHRSKSKITKQDLMQLLAISIAERRISFPKNIIYDELQAFEYEHTHWGVKYSAPAGEHDDCVSAIALADLCRRNNQWS